jgi:chloride channel protein, CIC family
MFVGTMALLTILKLVATASCYSSGNAGGIFGPSLFIGAMMGGAVGSVAHHFLPARTASPGAYALVGMGAAFAGIVRTPLTSVIMIFEMTRDYTIIVPLMISNLIAFFISQTFQREPIYEALAHQDGVHLPTAESRSRGSRVAQVMREPALILSPEIDAGAALALLETGGLDAAPVADVQGLRGMVRRSDLAKQEVSRKIAELVGDGPHRRHPTAADFPHVHPDHNLSLALERMGDSGLHVLPVVSRANIRQLLGIVVLADVLNSYGIQRTAAAQEYSG